MALIDTFRGAATELAEKGFIGISTAAAVIAQGIGFVAAINSAGSSAGGGGGGGGGGAAVAAQAATQAATQAPAQAPAQAAPAQSQNVIIDLIGATGMQVDQFQKFADTFNESVRQGLMTNVTVRGI